jgi:hypothetical protein
MNVSSSIRWTHAGVFLPLLFSMTACGPAPEHGFGRGEPHDDPGAGAAPPPADGGPAGDSAAPGSSALDSGVPEAPAQSVPDTGADAGTVVTSSDGFGAARTACIDEINRLRATQSLAPYTLVNTPSVDTCVDEQATYDERQDSAHDAWINNVYPSCNGNAQDECEGYGTDPAGIVACLDAMWNEKNYPNCLGCVGCTAFGGACPDCDFSGTMGHECGHYVNMSAVYFSQVWCGFAASPGTWATQNFQ